MDKPDSLPSSPSIVPACTLLRSVSRLIICKDRSPSLLTYRNAIVAIVTPAARCPHVLQHPSAFDRYSIIILLSACKLEESVIVVDFVSLCVIQLHRRGSSIFTATCDSHSDCGDSAQISKVTVDMHSSKSRIGVK